MMRQRIHLITLGVEDLDAAAAFYTALGWRRVAGTPAGIVVFDLWGASLALYPRADLARDIGRDVPRGSGAVTLACNVPAREEVAPVIEAARRAGATILREPHDASWGGHIAYFADPDGHVWEIAWNPHAPLGRDGEFQWNGF
jgi:catechol 2,3-dioxygenase-like lactoylglutathione lyase family enzyme